jgi:hypothetical protein
MYLSERIKWKERKEKKRPERKEKKHRNVEIKTIKTNHNNIKKQIITPYRQQKQIIYAEFTS